MLHPIMVRFGNNSNHVFDLFFEMEFWSDRQKQHRSFAQRAEHLGFSTVLIPEVNLNDIKGPGAPLLEAWTTAAALAARTQSIELMAAVRPGFRNPAVVAKMAANIDQISHGRFTLNVVSAWWAEEARQYGMDFVQHDERYARTAEFLTILKGMWTQERTTFHGQYMRVEEAYLAPKPVQKPWPLLYARGVERKDNPINLVMTCMINTVEESRMVLYHF